MMIFDLDPGDDSGYSRQNAVVYRGLEPDIGSRVKSLAIISVTEVTFEK